jgi:AraC family transcriptional regulator
METHTLHVKNMVCSRCIKVVRESLQGIGLTVEDIQLGIVTVRADSGPVHLPAIRAVLEPEGFELLEDKQAILVEKIKTTVIQLIYSGDIETLRVNFSDYISGVVEKDYHSISTLFSTLEHITLERYLIRQKIERAKELLSYNDLHLNEIARQLGYRSISHFSNQFRRIVGCSPRQYRTGGFAGRNFIDQLS